MYFDIHPLTWFQTSGRNGFKIEMFLYMEKNKVASQHYLFFFPSTVLVNMFVHISYVPLVLYTDCGNEMGSVCLHYQQMMWVLSTM